MTTFNKLSIYTNGEKLAEFAPNEPISNIIDYLELCRTEANLTDTQIIPEGCSRKVKESVVEDVADKEWTLWSSSDLAEDNEQIPLVKIRRNDNGELEAVAIGEDDFDQESFKIATNSLKYSVGKPDKDRILRVDKSLNHSDPFMSTELQRMNIIANKNVDKKPIEKVIGQDPKTVSDEPVEREVTDKAHPQGLQMLANQILMTNRDDLKAAANSRNTSEEKMVELFNELTGVDYYTEKITDEKQYNYILDLLGRSSDKYDDSYASPSENKYVMGLKDLTEDLIEKILLKQDPDFYKV